MLPDTLWTLFRESIVGGPVMVTLMFGQSTVIFVSGHENKPYRDNGTCALMQAEGAEQARGRAFFFSFTGVREKAPSPRQLGRQ